MAKSIGELSVVIGAEVSEFKRAMADMKTGLEDANKEIKSTGKEWTKSFGAIEKQARNLSLILMGVGGAAVAVFAKAAISTGQLGEELLQMKAKTGMSVVGLSRLKTMLEINGGSFSDLEVAVKAMSNTLDGAKKEGSAAAESLKRLGFSVADLQAMNPEQRFWALANAVAAVDDANERAAIAQDVFGKSGLNLLPMLAQGTEGIKQQQIEVDKLNTTMSEEAAESAAAFNKSREEIGKSFEGLQIQIAEAIMPALTELAEKFTNVITKVTDWVRENENLAKAIGTAAGFILAAGGILYALSRISKAIIAINSALMIMQSLSGPAGWTNLAIGVGIAGASLIAMNEIMKKAGGGAAMPPSTGMPEGGYDNASRNRREKQLKAKYPQGINYEGKTFSPLDWTYYEENAKKYGFSIPEMGQGGIVNMPTLAMIGERGPEAVVPLSEMGGMGGNTINNYFGVMPGDDVTIRKIVRQIKDVLGQEGRRNAFGPVNQGYFYGRSST